VKNGSRECVSSENRKAFGVVSLFHCSLTIAHFFLALPLILLSGTGTELHASDRSGWTAPSFSRLDSLFLAAATGEPRFQPLRDSSERALLADSGLTDYLVKQRLSRQTPRQRQYVERLFILRSDSGRRAGSRETLARALSSMTSPVDDSARAQLLYIGSRLGDTAFRATALPWLKTSFEPARRAALRSLGSYPNPDDAPLLWERMQASHGLERQQCLWALEAHGPLRDWRRLLPLLSDENAFNRRKARDLLLKATDSSWATLRRAIPKKPEQTRDPELRRLLIHEWRLLALDAKGGREFLKKETASMTVEERKFFGVAPWRKSE
jgi:hypothetical protein